MRSLATLLSCLLAAQAGLLATPAFADPRPAPGPMSIASQGSFFIGGREVKSDTLSPLPNYATSGTITVDQMYVRYQVPAPAPKPAVTFIHGCCLTGKTWETTPDGRMGWDEYFLRLGHPVYVIDQSWRGRSAGDPSAVNAVRSGTLTPDKLPVVFSAGKEGAWAIFRFGKAYPEVYPGERFPLAAQDEFWKQMVPDYLNALPAINPTVPALSTLAQKIGGTVLISHSQSGIYPFQTAAISTKGIAAIISIEPGACPDPKDDVTPYKAMPIMVLWGDHVEESPRWKPRIINCRAFVAAVNAAGGKAEMLVLPEIGIKGNSHMLMQDDNNLDIADILDAWIAKHVTAAK